MSILCETALALLSAVGVTALTLWGADWFLRRRGTLWLFALPSDAQMLEYAAREIARLRRGGADVRLCVLTDGLDEEGRRAARLMLEDNTAHAACKAEELVLHGGGTAGGSNPFGYIRQ